MTQKHKRKVLAIFNNILALLRAGRRIPCRTVQKLLGLQIWISTVFRVAHQFLTSSCDVLKRSLNKGWFYGNSDRELTKRLLFDLQFWRRFISTSPKASFTYFLDQLPANSAVLFSDASSSWGMSSCTFPATQPSSYRSGRDVLAIRMGGVNSYHTLTGPRPGCCSN